ncbi:MAG: DUF3781 domain-containing protein [Erysipelotrichales bacterium]|nr:DUF3781 domain-containing protein [Erysipelotrichales bacterium]
MLDEKCINLLLSDVDKIHTTELGYQRIRKVIKLSDAQLINYIKDIVKNSETIITKRGKNYYIYFENMRITINSYNYCVITAHSIGTK